MRKCSLLVLFVLMCLCLTSCTILNTWCLKGDGKDLKGGYQMITGAAGRADVVFARSLLITTQKVDKAFLENLPTAKVIVSDDNKAKSVSIGK